MLTIVRADEFTEDLYHRFRWFLGEAGIELASRFDEAVDRTLEKLARHPTLGRPRHFSHPKLQGLRSLTVDHPFGKHLIFYRVEGSTLQAWRIMHGARNLSRRLLEPNE